MTHAVSQAGVTDLAEAARLGLSRGVVRELLPPDAYRVASPAELLPLGVPQLLVHGEDDEIVPVELSRDYHAAAVAAGDAVDLVTLPGRGPLRAPRPGLGGLAGGDRLAAVTRDEAAALDAADPLAPFRERFVLDDGDRIYVDGNSLGRLPRETPARIARASTSGASASSPPGPTGSTCRSRSATRSRRSSALSRERCSSRTRPR